MANKDTKAPKVPQGPEKARQRKVYFTEEDWRFAKVRAAERGVSVSEVLKVAIHQLDRGHEQSATAPKPTQTVRDLTNAMPSIRDTPKAPQQ